jgi:hypothetical protein
MERNMVFPNENPPPRGNNLGRMNGTTGWAIAGAVILLVLALIFVFGGRGASHDTREHAPTTTTQSDHSTR